MLREDVKKSLLSVAEILNSNKINWMLIGSCNLAVQGIELNPRDIDICVDKKDFENLRRIFSDFNSSISKFSSKYGGEAYKLNFFMDNVEIEFLGETSQNIYFQSLERKDFIKRDIYGKIICLNKLENEYKSYLKMKRFDKAEKIKNFLDDKFI